MILETERLYLREMTKADLPALKSILQNSEVMYAYEHAFSDEEVQQWLDKQLASYLSNGFGLWAVIRKKDEQMIGQCGINIQEDQGYEIPELVYLLRQDCWHQGYATEAARGCVEYAFEMLCLPELYALIREDNQPSLQVAKRLEMVEGNTIMRHYRGKDIPHLVYYIVNEASPLLDI